jgi:hypothetical protein
MPIVPAGGLPTAGSKPCDLAFCLAIHTEDHGRQRCRDAGLQEGQGRLAFSKASSIASVLRWSTTTQSTMVGWRSLPPANTWQTGAVTTTSCGHMHSLLLHAVARALGPASPG